MAENAALAGVKVLDFTWVVAGPMITKFFADFGATVVRVESMKRPDPSRVSAPYKDRKSGVNRSGHHAFFKPNSYSLALDLNQPESRDILKGLVQWADVVAESYTPGQMKKWGLGYEQIKAIKPDIIMVSTSMQGQTGPHSQFAGYGMHLAGLAGYIYLTGWPDKEASPPFGAYTDFIVPPFGAAAIIAALENRRRTGEGAFLDFSQFECGLQFIAPQLLDFFVNNRVASRRGNYCESAVPHGAYRCKGDDRWCAIAVFGDDQWDLLCRAAGQSYKWAGDRRFSSFLKRKRNEDELDRLIESWTINHTDREIMTLLQSKGVPCGIVQSPKDILEDAHLQERGAFCLMEHPEIGPFHHLGQAFILSETPNQCRMPAATLGQHTEYICREILKLPEDRFIELLNKGVFE